MAHDFLYGFGVNAFGRKVASRRMTQAVKRQGAFVVLNLDASALAVDLNHLGGMVGQIEQSGVKHLAPDVLLQKPSRLSGEELQGFVTVFSVLTFDENGIFLEVKGYRRQTAQFAASQSRLNGQQIHQIALITAQAIRDGPFFRRLQEFLKFVQLKGSADVRLAS